MIETLLQLDLSLFELIQRKLANPLFDLVMPFASGNRFFMPALVLACLLLVWRGRVRGAACVGMLLVVLAIGDGLVNPTLKTLIARPRPGEAMRTAVMSDWDGRRSSMPSSHAANWFSATAVLLVYFRRSWRVMLPLAVVVSYSRVYNGVHYPSDVIMGAILGFGYAGATMVCVQMAWRAIGKRLFPLWWERFPSVVVPNVQPLTPESDEEPEFAPRDRDERAAVAPRHELVEKQWLVLGYFFIAACLFARLWYLAGGPLELSEDEAYQWTWSKHLALSYYSKPPLIALAQYVGTTLWGDTEFGVRFLSPVIASFLGVLLLQFFAREVNARAGVFLLLALSASLMMAAGSILMTVDPLSVLFWTAATLAGWRAAQPKGSTADWCWVGLWMGLGFLSKYTQLFQWLCWAVFFFLWAPARKHLRKPGPWLALTINLLCTLPVVIWNMRHQWVTVTHLSDRAGTNKPWTPTLRYFAEFLGAEFLLLNPVFFVGLAWACVAFWRKGRHNPKLLYFFSMGAPLFLVYLLFSFRGRVLPNWIAPAVVPLFCLMILYWDAQWRLGKERVLQWFQAGLLVGGLTVILSHDTRLIGRLIKVDLPARYDPLMRVRGWSQTAAAVESLRHRLSEQGKPVFILADHYGIVGQFSFYIPEAKRAVTTNPLVYYPQSPYPKNQYWFWPTYTNRVGQNALFVREISKRTGQLKPIPPRIEAEFESTTDLGALEVKIGKQATRRLQIFECRNLK